MISFKCQYVIGLHRYENPTKNWCRHNVACPLGLMYIFGYFFEKEHIYKADQQKEHTNKNLFLGGWLMPSLLPSLPPDPYGWDSYFGVYFLWSAIYDSWSFTYVVVFYLRDTKFRSKHCTSYEYYGVAAKPLVVKFGLTTLKTLYY